MQHKTKGKLSVIDGSNGNTVTYISPLDVEQFPATEVRSFLAELETIATTLEGQGTSTESITKDISTGRLDGVSDIKLNCDDAPSGQELVTNLLTRNLLAARRITERKGEIDPAFRELYEILLKTRDHLEKMIVTQSWSVRETDLFPFIKALLEIDDERRDGEFVDADGKTGDIYTQKVSFFCCWGSTFDYCECRDNQLTDGFEPDAAISPA